MAAQVHPPLLDREMVTLFSNTFKAPYYKHVMGNLAQQFTNVVIMAEGIEQGGKVIGSLSQRKIGGLVERKKRSIILKAIIGARKAKTKNTILNPHYHKSSTSISNPHSLQENLTPKITKPKAIPKKTYQRNQ